MKWKLRLFGATKIDEVETVDLARQKADARAALARSNAALTAAHKQQPEVSRLGRSLREIRQANHFAEKIQATFRSA